MSQISKKRLSIALVLTFLLLYFLGGLGEISGNTTINPSAPLIIIIMHLFIISSFTFFAYVLLGILKKPLRLLLLLGSAFLIGPLVYYTLFPPFLDPQSRLLSDLYILLGDPLRDTYGINWYWLDWGGWMYCIAVYLLALYFYIANMLIGGILDIIKKNTSQKKR